ncbi:MAG: RNA-binding domain-containing protein [Candidatus Shapirobacteria bacterium]
MSNLTNKDETLTFEEIAEILKNSDFDKLISQRESGVFEAKQKHPYDLPKRKAIIELIKDVVSFANGGGGYIICGLSTEKRANSPHDYVTALDLMSKIDFYDGKQINGIIITNVYPRLDIKVDWCASSGDASLGLGVISILPQDEGKKYFIIKITKVESESTKEFFGIPIRTDDDITWLTVQELHKLSKRSPNSLQEFHQSLSNQMDEVKEKISIITLVPAIDIDSIPAKIEETIYGNKQ